MGLNCTYCVVQVSSDCIHFYSNGNDKVNGNRPSCTCMHMVCTGLIPRAGTFRVSDIVSIPGLIHIMLSWIDRLKSHPD